MRLLFFLVNMKEGVTITIFVNGERAEAKVGQNLENWLAQNGLAAKHIVVELNAEILSRKDWSRRILQQGDNLEIVTFVGGG